MANDLMIRINDGMNEIKVKKMDDKTKYRVLVLKSEPSINARLKRLKKTRNQNTSQLSLI